MHRWKLHLAFSGLQFCRWQYRSIFIRLAVVASQICKITRNSKKIRTYSSSRSSKVINLGANWKRICNFLLVINSNFGRISYRFRDNWHMKLENNLFSHPILVSCPRSGGTRQNFSMKLIAQKLEGWGYCTVKIAWSWLVEQSLTPHPTQHRSFRRRGMILTSTVFDLSTHVTNRQTDGQMDRQTDRGNCERYERLAYMLSRAKINNKS